MVLDVLPRLLDIATRPTMIRISPCFLQKSKRHDSELWGSGSPVGEVGSGGISGMSGGESGIDGTSGTDSGTWYSATIAPRTFPR